MTVKIFKLEPGSEKEINEFLKGRDHLIQGNGIVTFPDKVIFYLNDDTDGPEATMGILREAIRQGQSRLCASLTAQRYWRGQTILKRGGTEKTSVVAQNMKIADDQVEQDQSNLSIMRGMLKEVEQGILTI
jgi:hypothetical protein